MLNKFAHKDPSPCSTLLAMFYPFSSRFSSILTGLLWNSIKGLALVRVRNMPSLICWAHFLTESNQFCQVWYSLGKFSLPVSNHLCHSFTCLDLTFRGLPSLLPREDNKSDLPHYLPVYLSSEHGTLPGAGQTKKIVFKLKITNQ